MKDVKLGKKGGCKRIAKEVKNIKKELLLDLKQEIGRAHV